MMTIAVVVVGAGVTLIEGEEAEVAGYQEGEEGAGPAGEWAGGKDLDEGELGDRGICIDCTATFHWYGLLWIS